MLGIRGLPLVLSLAAVGVVALVSVGGLRTSSLLSEPEKQGIDAKSAVKDLETYYDEIPTHAVNFFHEPQLQGKPEAGGLEEHTPAHLRAKAASADLLNYYAKIPTHNVNAFHEPGVPNANIVGDSPEHSRVQFSADKARHEIDSYFHHIPAHSVDAYHEKKTTDNNQHGLKATAATKDLDSYFNDLLLAPPQARAAHTQRQGVTSKSALRDIENYFMSIPTKNVNADHVLPARPSHSAKQQAGALQAAVQVVNLQALIPRGSASVGACFCASDRATVCAYQG